MNGRRRLAALWAGLALMCVFAPTRGVIAAAQPGAQQIVLHVGVTDNSSRYITDLAAGEVSVLENGLKQEVTLFRPAAELPVRLALLIDTSASMVEKLPITGDATSAFVRRLRMDDLAAIVSFNSRVQLLESFTGSVPALEQAIGRLSAGGSTSLFNAVAIVLNDFQKAAMSDRATMRRQVIILVTDGADTSSLVSFSELLERVKRSDVVIYAISTPDGPRVGGQFLRQLAKETGGAAFFPRRMSDMASAYAQISADLSNQYEIGFVPRDLPRDGKWRRVEVRIDRRNAKSRTRTGYFGAR